MTDSIIREQIAYYDEWFHRLGRYDRGEEINGLWFNEVAVVKKALYQLGTVENILELACGTGIWTQELLKIGKKITALDASQEVIEINRAKVGDANVYYRQVDLFSWEPDVEYDLVFFSFWLSHVPPKLLDSFLEKVYRSVRAGGQVFIIDSRFDPISTAKDHVLENDSNIQITRKLNDCNVNNIVATNNR
ncbi:class I SAM-dependent methyltransferase [Aetokthonos hydrillicola Thurmond2011]|jgi:demethylmenaquinone methyltransferase/2-methoxy-6-polyprenyl-1,4-benzoquinol methylase|uniref:Class I SAM-dependent methyltransferase n=1 Tax=Aetokthonos hydrillicola Thurmond2011 TaxID=2712845 RepID=A0AAP5IB94_9CYAN|nr:class I SAM-dependent methyltransferase [Aetokthonos hydrillicola]MBO3464028.1 class I SAM-dependent methyltransferase [Aetokthonos hydrillicola CCALA 1050]MBW4591224.1 class I SAM-dependent methyltransferase [Aetokthonos hydrillicola CCALA 1050]MDR9896937.1 class I SAM-dependent methyltransferase [Aetokthonos hydrillicola Thurmond2011]